MNFKAKDENDVRQQQELEALRQTVKEQEQQLNGLGSAYQQLISQFQEQQQDIVKISQLQIENESLKAEQLTMMLKIEELSRKFAELEEQKQAVPSQDFYEEEDEQPLNQFNQEDRKEEEKD